MAFRGFKSGIYKPVAGKCVHTKFAKYRSSYELEFCKIIDASPKVVSWEYEHFYIGYDFHGRHHHYLVDFNLVLDNGQKILVEIKPYTFYLRAMEQRDKNWAKWNAAINFAKNHNYKFKVITERSIPILRQVWLGRKC
jgi:hypothetical protein